MLAYFFALQLILLVYTESNLKLPLSASKLILTIIEILNLSSFDKKMLVDKLHMTVGGIFDNLSGLSLIGIGGAFILAVMIPSLLLFKHPKIRIIA